MSARSCPDRAHSCETLVPYAVTSLILVIAGLASGARGLIVLAAVIGAVAALSAPLDRRTTWDAAMSPERPADPARPWLVGIAGAAPAAALGLVTIRVSATDELGISTANATPTLLVGAAVVVSSAAFAAGFAALNRWVTAREFSSAQWLRTAAVAATITMAGPAFANPTNLGVVGIFCISMASLLLALTAIRALGDALLASRSWWRYAMPSALLSLGVRQSPFALLIAMWMAALPLLGSLGYHDVVLASRGGSPFQPPATQTLDQVADGWVERQNLASGPRTLSALTVASSGGGIRSAYWTAAVLDCIIDGETVGDDPCAGRTTPGKAEHRRDSLSMLSGVSGGSVGLVSYIAQVDGGWQAATGALPPRWYDKRFGADFQAAVFSEMLTGDAVEFFLRTGRGDDRARTLELAFEAQWPNGELSRGFLTAQNSGEPFLFLHGFSAENGCRFNLSILDSNGLQPAGSCSAETIGPRPALHGTTDLADFLCGDDDLRRSTVALLSARFPYVTPSGHLTTQDCHRAPADTNIVDGGYRSSSGSSAIAELWPALETEIQTVLNATSPGSCLVPIHVQIDNSETAAADVTGPPNEVLLPLLAVARAVNGVDTADRSATRSLFDADRYFTIRPVAHPGDQAPLGWTLSQTSRADLQDQLRVNRTAIEALRQLLDNPEAASADSCQPNPSISPTQVPNGG